MRVNPAKDFDEIASDYAFFETHATEAEQDAREYARRLAGLSFTGNAVKMLDFGCGSGTFTLRLLKELGWQPRSVELTLAEPAEGARRLAVSRLGEFGVRVVGESSAIPAGLIGGFDVVLSNHVFYYVSDLKDILQQLVDAASSTGLFLTAIAGRSNALIQFWTLGFELLGQPVPYHTSEDVEVAFRELGVGFEKQEVAYRMGFVDNEENRMRVIRFLLADHLTKMPRQPLLELFDQHSHGGRIEIETTSDHYAVRGLAAS